VIAANRGQSDLRVQNEFTIYVVPLDIERVIGNWERSDATNAEKYFAALTTRS
jgi:hypothetical protein